MRRASAVLAIALLGTVSHAKAQSSGEPAKGLVVANEICAECHAVTRAQTRSPNSRSPTFAEVAAVPGMTAAALSVTLTTPHAGMPMFILSPEQRADVIAYILSLRGEAR